MSSLKEYLATVADGDEADLKLVDAVLQIFNDNGMSSIVQLKRSRYEDINFDAKCPGVLPGFCLNVVGHTLRFYFSRCS